MRTAPLKEGICPGCEEQHQIVFSFGLWVMDLHSVTGFRGVCGGAGRKPLEVVNAGPVVNPDVYPTSDDDSAYGF